MGGQGASKRWKSLNPGGSSMWNSVGDVRPSVLVDVFVGKSVCQSFMPNGD